MNKMKKLLLLIPLILLTTRSSAKCGMSGVEFWPVGKTISKTPTLMIEGYSSSQKIIAGLNQQHKVYLRAKDHTVPLQVQEILKGRLYLTQAIL